MPFAQKHVVLDSPVNNFATLNPLDTQLTGTFSNGNLIGSDLSTVRFTMNPLPVGKWYAEFYVSKNAGYGVNHIGFGRIDVKLSTAGWNTGDYTFYKSYLGNGQVQHDGGSNPSSSDSAGNGYNIGDIISVILDFDNETINFLKNNQTVPGNFATDVDFSNVSNYHIDGKLRNDLGFIVRPDGGHGLICNFGQNPTFCGEKAGGGRYSDANGLGQFYYKPPWGALALCSANIEKNEIYAAKERADQHFKPVIWTGQTEGDTYEDGKVTTGFQPDLVWAKNRDAGAHGVIIDSVRGAGRTVFTSSNQGENVNTNSDGILLGFDSSGFSVGTHGNINGENEKIVAWSWKAGGAPEGANTAMIDGVGTTVEAIAEKAGADITPTGMSVNTKAGFSIVKYPGTETDSQTVPHGLAQRPDFVITKSLGTGNWGVWHSNLSGNSYYLGLNQTAKEYSSTTVYHNFTNETIGVGSDVRANAADGVIAYCWHSVPGYSKFGSYTGNGDTDGPFVYTGFKPAFVMIKCSSSDISGYASWTIYDNARDPYNQMNKVLYANKAVGEGYRGNGTSTYTDMFLDFTSNGFKHRQAAGETNGSSSPTYIYMAFAEAPPTVPEPIKYSPKKERHALKFDGSSYLSRTFGSPTNGDKWVYSYWQKGKAQSNRGCTLSAGNYNYGTFITYESEWFRFGRFSGGYTWLIETDQVFRDPSAWRHIVITWDTSLSSNQVKIYVNGALASLRSNSQPTAAGDINASGIIHKIGARVVDNSHNFPGYLADIHFIDGQALGPEHFGKTENGIWEPKHYQGSYGTNGFFLDFHPENLEYKADNTLDYVKDSSGNGNHWNGN